MIDREPRVGRIVIRHSDDPKYFIDEFWIGRILMVRGKQITFDMRLEDGRTVPRLMLEKTVAVVCDTDDEVKEIVAFNRASAARYNSFIETERAKWLELTGTPLAGSRA